MEGNYEGMGAKWQRGFGCCQPTEKRRSEATPLATEPVCAGSIENAPGIQRPQGNPPQRQKFI